MVWKDATTDYIVHEALGAALAEKGYKRDDNNPEFLIDFQFVTLPAFEQSTELPEGNQSIISFPR